MAKRNRPLNVRPPKRKYEEPSRDYILARVREAKAMATGIRQIGDELTRVAGGEKDIIQHMIDLFKGKVDLGLPDDKLYVGFAARSAKPADIIFRVMGMLSEPAQREYIGPPTTKTEVKDRIERHLNALPDYFFRRYASHYSLERWFWLLLTGRAYILQAYLPDYWEPEELARRKGESDEDYNARVAGYRAWMGPPFTRASLDPRTVYPIMTGLHGPREFVRIYRVQRLELDKAMALVGKRIDWGRNGTIVGVENIKGGVHSGMQLAREDTAPTDYIEFYEFLDDVMCYYVADDKIVHAYQHDGSMKIVPAYGLTTGLRDYADMAMGILWPVRNEIPQYDFMRTLWLQKAYLEVFPQLVAQLRPEDPAFTGDDGQPVVWDIEPGTIKQVRGELRNILRDAGSGVDFRAFIEMLAADIDMATIPPIARGIGGAQQPGYAINQLAQAMRTLWRPIIEWAELQEEILDEHYLFSVKHFVDAPVTAFIEVEDRESGRYSGDYVTIDPDDIDDYFRVRVRIKPELPIDKQGQAMMWWNLYERGGVPFELFVREGLDMSNPAEIARKARRDAFMRAFLPKAAEDAMALGRVELTNEIIRQRGLDRLVPPFNADLQALKQREQQQQAAQGAPGSPGAPGPVPAGMEGNPPPPSTYSPGSMLAPQQRRMMESGAEGFPPIEGMNPSNPSPGPRR